MKRICSRALVVLGLAFLAALPARALDLPPASTSVTCSTFLGTLEDPISCNGGADQASLSLGPVATVQAAATYPGGFVQVPAGATSAITYSWAFVGGNPGDLLHVQIDFHLFVSAFGSANARSFATVVSQSPTTPFAQVCVETSGLCGSGNTGALDGTMHVLARSGEVNTLSLEATAGGAFGSPANGGTALADPHIFLDPSFPTTGYTLVLSPGVGNSLPVPEPGAALLMAAGLAALARVRRRRA